MEDTRISHYRVGRLLGRGGMGEVYEALDLDLDRPVALKFVAPELASDAETLKRFEREARAAAALIHPHIAVLYAFDRTTERPFIAMELMSGVSLRDRLRDGPLPVAEALAIVRDVASGLALAHRRGIAHRDIKPENLMFDRDGAVKITDFGLARATQASRLTMTGSTLGTAAYMAPESVRASQAAMGEAAAGALPAGAPADVFALGVTLHEILSGALPFAGDSPLALLYAIANEAPRSLRLPDGEPPAEVATLVTRMLAKDPDERPDAVTVTRELALRTGVPLTEPAAWPSGGAENAGTTPVPTPGSVTTGAVSMPIVPRTEELDVERRAALPPVPVTDRALVAPPRPAGRGAWRALWLAPVLGAMALVVWLGPWRGARNDRAETAARILNNQGFEAMQGGDVATAQAHFREALRVMPGYGQAAVNLARALIPTDRDSSVLLLQQTVREHPKEPALLASAYTTWAEIDERDQAWQDAAHHYATAALADPGDVTHLNNQAYALIMSGRPDTAQVVLAEAILRNPNRAPLYKNMGLAWLRRGEADSALAWLDRAEQRDANLASVWQVRAEAQVRRHDLAGARSSVARFVALGGDSASAAALKSQIMLASAH
jgi:Tfp pilus assembly protein PilF